MAGLRKKFFAWILKRSDAFNRQLYAVYKPGLLGTAKGRVVEIGPGTGVNLEYFTPGIEWYGIEPNTHFHTGILEKARKKNINAILLPGDAASIPLPDESVDNVVCTLVLCSVKNPADVIKEIKRVLKKDGRLIFIEHVAAAPHSSLRRAQNLLNPLNRLMADGCNCNRETGALLKNAGFRQLEVNAFRLPGAMRLHAPHIMGYAVN